MLWVQKLHFARGRIRTFNIGFLVEKKNTCFTPLKNEKALDVDVILFREFKELGDCTSKNSLSLKRRQSGAFWAEVIKSWNISYLI